MLYLLTANGAPNKPNWGTNVGTGQKNPSSGKDE